MGTTERQTTLDREYVEDFARRYAEAWTAHDAGGIAAGCTEDVVWTDPSLNETLHGRDGVRRFATETFRMVPDFVVSPTDDPYVSPTAARVLLPYVMRGTMSGPWVFLDMAPTGRSFEIEGVDRWEMRDGLIAHYSTYFDSLSLSRQLGVLPPEGSRADRAITRLQHVQARFQRRSAG
ncbi:MAG TPA: nuclear transport factor 2 family protein [Thermoleophilaceae bacterium]|jgi:steroid delta-isomerase-like uncharacterized protein